MLDNKKYTGNKTDTPDFLKVLLTLKKNIMRDLNVAEVCKVLEVNNNVYTVVSINNNNLRLKCTKLSSLNPKKDDLVLVVFTNTDYRLNLSKTNKPFQNLQEETLHSLNYGIITGSVGEGGSTGIGTRVTVNGIFQPTWNADTKANASDLANYLPLTGGNLIGDLIFNNSGIKIGKYYIYSTNNNEAFVIETIDEPYKIPFFYQRGAVTDLGDTSSSLRLKGSEDRPKYLDGDNYLTSLALITDVNNLETNINNNLNLKSNYYSWNIPSTPISYSGTSTGTHTIDISSMITDYDSNNLYEVIWANESYCANIAYLRQFSDVIPDPEIYTQRFSTNGRQGGNICNMLVKRYLYYRITGTTLGTCNNKIVAYRRVSQ